MPHLFKEPSISSMFTDKIQEEMTDVLHISPWQIETSLPLTVYNHGVILIKAHTKIYLEEILLCMNYLLNTLSV